MLSRSKELFYKFCKFNDNTLLTKRNINIKIQHNKRSYYKSSYNLSDNQDKNTTPNEDMKSILYGEEVPVSELENEENVLKIDSRTLRKGIEYCKFNIK